MYKNLWVCIGAPARHIGVHRSSRTECLFFVHGSLQTAHLETPSCVLEAHFFSNCQEEWGVALLVFWHFSTNVSWGQESLSLSANYLVGSMGAASPCPSLADLSLMLQRNEAWDLTPITLMGLRAFHAASYVMDPEWIWSYLGRSWLPSEILLPGTREAEGNTPWALCPEILGLLMECPAAVMPSINTCLLQSHNQSNRCVDTVQVDITFQCDRTRPVTNK